MSVFNLNGLLRLFRSSAINDEEKTGLAHKALLRTLAHAANADSNIEPREITTIQQIYRKYSGLDVAESDIRVAARSDLFKSTTLIQYLADAQRHLSMEEKRRIVLALIDVFRSDERVSSSETEFFNDIAQALRLTHADIAGL